ncbi:2764_t:CDS:1, partial [Dentiscutata erythropus]
SMEIDLTELNFVQTILPPPFNNSTSNTNQTINSQTTSTFFKLPQASKPTASTPVITTQLSNSNTLIQPQTSISNKPATNSTTQLPGPTINNNNQNSIQLLNNTNHTKNNDNSTNNNTNNNNNSNNNIINYAS